MTAFKYLTDDEARSLTRSELLDRIESQQQYYERKRRKTPADEAAMDELSRIMHKYLNIGAAFEAAFASFTGHLGVSYSVTRPADDDASRGTVLPWAGEPEDLERSAAVTDLVARTLLGGARTRE